MASNGITFTPDSMIITQLVQNFKGTHIHMHRYHGDVMSLLYVLKNRK
jgi:hypothetical protein